MDPFFTNKLLLLIHLPIFWGNWSNFSHFLVFLVFLKLNIRTLMPLCSFTIIIVIIATIIVDNAWFSNIEQTDDWSNRVNRTMKNSRKKDHSRLLNSIRISLASIYIKNQIFNKLKLCIKHHSSYLINVNDNFCYFQLLIIKPEIKGCIWFLLCELLHNFWTLVILWHVLLNISSQDRLKHSTPSNFLKVPHFPSREGVINVSCKNNHFDDPYDLI